VRLRNACMFLMLSLVAELGFAQPQSDLDRLDEKLTRHFQKTLPGWKHERVEPLMKGENVLIQFWSSAHRKVKISVVPHKSVNEAKEVVQRRAAYASNKESLTGIGDEGFAGGYGESDMTFRKGRFVVYVSATAEIGARPEERMLDQEQRFELMKSEVRRWSREFAKQAADAVDSP
jgi:hypothetical protein